MSRIEPSPTYMPLVNAYARCFLSERVMLGVIVINLIAVFLEECGFVNVVVSAIDVTCTVLFAIEMAVKIYCYGWKEYWSKNWNRFDAVLVIASLPSLVVVFFPEASFLDISIILILRIVRVFRFFRLFKMFPTFEAISHNFWLAMKESTPVLLCFVLIVLVWSMVTCFFFKGVAPEYFGSPVESIYTTFRLCTIEGWYEIPDDISQLVSPFMGHIVRLYFVIIVILGGVIGISLVNSVFVDAMVSDNNDSLEAKVSSLQEQLDRIEQMLKEKDKQ